MPPLLSAVLELALLGLVCFRFADAFASAFLRLLARISSTLACALSDIPESDIPEPDIPEPDIPEPLSDLSAFWLAFLSDVLLDLLLAFGDSVLAEDLSAEDLAVFLRSRPGSNGSAGRSPFFSSLAPRSDWEAILSLSLKSLSSSKSSNKSLKRSDQCC